MQGIVITSIICITIVILCYINKMEGGNNEKNNKNRK